MNILLLSAFLFGYIMEGTTFLLTLGTSPELVYSLALGEPQSHWESRHLVATFIQGKCFAMVARAIAYATLVKLVLEVIMGGLISHPFVSDMIHLLH